MAHSVSLTWTASTDSVDGYNVYRGTQPTGGEATTPINGATLVTGTSYSDTNVTIGSTYDYYITSVKSGLESIHSTEVTVRILPAAPTGLTATVV